MFVSSIHYVLVQYVFTLYYIVVKFVSISLQLLILCQVCDELKLESIDFDSQLVNSTDLVYFTLLLTWWLLFL